eukprot:TRINITY_DN1660_c0_g1_i1.p1 TRINITY_DN1660_c0_g1~~TRINITY_DN1660_c0_g1_i1.p1  ORF type:complete len:546 (-),score=100.23 TRINITY_DN1660_c0_g1_i1:3-1640(-)
MNMEAFPKIPLYASASLSSINTAVVPLSSPRNRANATQIVPLEHSKLSRLSGRFEPVDPLPEPPTQPIIRQKILKSGSKISRRFDEKEKEKEKESQNGIQIKFASLDTLIGYLTQDNCPDVNFRKHFLLTFHSFITPTQLLSELKQRYTAQPTAAIIALQTEFSKFIERRNNARTKIVAVLKDWVSIHYDDFLTDPQLLSELHKFIDEHIQCVTPETASSLKIYITKNTTQRHLSSFSFERSYNNLSKPHDLFESEEPLAIAQVITSIEYDLYKNLHPKEFINLNWTKKHLNLSPTINKYTAQFNRESNWIVVEILKRVDIKSRIVALSKAIRIMEQLYELHNYNGVMAILAGLNSSSIGRLKKTWGGLEERLQNKKTEFDEMMSPERNHKRYRELIHSTEGPLLPYLGLYLTDLMFIDQGNPDKDSEGQINFAKRKMVAEVLLDIQSHQTKSFTLVHAYPRLVAALRKLEEPMPEEDAFKISLRLEPRNPSEAIDTMLLNEEFLRNQIRILETRNAELESSNADLRTEVLMLRECMKKGISLSE